MPLSEEHEAPRILNFEIGFDQLFKPHPVERVLGNKMIGPISRCSFPAFRRIIMCENKNGNIRMNFLDFLGESQAAFSRQSDIHKNEVREEGIDSLQRLGSVCRFVNGYSGERHLQTLFEGLSEEAIILHD